MPINDSRYCINAAKGIPAFVVLLICWFSTLFSCKDSAYSHIDYFKDGSIKTTCKTIEDSIVLITDYYQNHTIKNVRTAVNGQLKGISQSFNEQGVMIAKTTWLHDKQHGQSLYYYPNGRLKQRVNFMYGLRCGEYKEYYNSTGNQVRFLVNYLVIGKKEYPNEYFEYDRAGKLINQSPLVKAAYKTNYSDCTAHLTLQLITPDFPEMTVLIGNYDAFFNLNDSTSLHTYSTTRLLNNVAIKLPVVNDTIIRGVIVNYKQLKSDRKPLTKMMGKDLYWSLAIKGCQRLNSHLTSID
ncbi:hypothetical protein G8759_25140 [Spirosoma aureum]|uniref:Toxin-antitoxin system YwqK family antitoxin n=1 Tax=Spirosoma aureum TaxID=2692134 RepID=A0A6G9AT68_9BACT|nr:hypothetical protein [Spirosoma aureum]QIP15682.1 hypothetical protein G8759_25140 [Spirosoma aureum]